MEFDKSRVYTALNAEELRAGDSVIIADDLTSLKKQVAADAQSFKLSAVCGECCECRFGTAAGAHSLAYLVERATEKKWRAYNDCDEMIADFKKRSGLHLLSSLVLPLVWVRNKSYGNEYQVIGFYGDGVTMCSSSYDLDTLFDNYTYLDGSPCGVLGDE